LNTYDAFTIRWGSDDASSNCYSASLREKPAELGCHPDLSVKAYQGTLGLEILSQVPSADALIIPIGGGGLISGIAIAARALKPDITIIGVEAEGAASCRVSLDAGELRTLPHISTIADGIALKRPGELTFPIIQQLVDEVVTVKDEETIRAILLLQEPPLARAL